MSAPKPPSKGAPADKKTELTFKTLEKIRSTNPLVQELLKTASNYQKQAQRLSDAGKQFADSIQRLSQFQSGDIKDTFSQIGEIFRNVELKREQVNRTIQDDLIANVQKSFKPEEIELNQFESDYKKMRSATRQQISKIEQQTKKAGKKSQQELQLAILQLGDKIKEAEQTKSDKLRTAMVLERKKYCNILTHMIPVISTTIEMYSEGMRLKDIEPSVRVVASSMQQLPSDAEALISSQERTFVSIQSEGSSYSSSYSSSYDTPYDDSSYDSSHSLSSSHGAVPKGGNTSLGTATALYDYCGQSPEDLSFYAGDIVTVTAEDDGNGWLTGELNGLTGIFPTSYVQRN